MRGLISLNFKINGQIINDYPVVLYYNGDEESISNSFIENEELYDYIYRNLVTLKAYSHSEILDITYFSEDDNEGTEEKIDKHRWKIDELLMLSSHPDLKIKLLNDILIDIVNETDDTDTLIKKLKDNGLTNSTIVNFIRYKAQHYGFNNDNVVELVREIQETIKS